MIRYQCPHCQRICETSEMLRGFSVFCLGCRQAVRVPQQSTEPNDLPSLPVPPAAPVLKEDVAPILPLKPVVIPPPPVGVRQPTSVVAPLTTTGPIAIEVKPPEPRRPVDSAARRRWLVRAGFGALFGVLLIAVGGFGFRWYAKRKATRAERAEQILLTERKDTIRSNFTTSDLKRLAAKVPQWTIEPNDVTKIKGKIVVLSVTDTDDGPSFWNDLLAAWPLRPEDANIKLIKELFERGKFDELTFELPEFRWAEAGREADTLIGINWHKEFAGHFQGGELVPAGASPVPNGAPLAKRWRATVIVLDKPSARLTARTDLLGPVPKARPAAGKKESVGARPLEALRDWLLRLEAGPAKAPP